MTVAIRPAMQALYSWLQAGSTVTFEATADDDVLSDPSTVTGLIPGLPIFGPGVAQGTLIEAIADDGSSVTLSQPVGEAGAGTFIVGFLRIGRRVIPWTEVSDQTALFLRRVGFTDVADHETGWVTTTLECEAWLYSNLGQNTDIVPDDVLTALEEMVRACFVPDGDPDDNLCTLGGAVYWARVEGQGAILPGDIGPQAVAHIPIRVTLNPF
jgi:hypothetical protein